MKKILLLDGNSMLFRAFYATSYTRPMKTSTNIPTNAIYAFQTMLNKALELINPDEVLVAWDSGKPTFRHEMYEDYKGTRKSLPEELVIQFPISREYLDAAGIKQYQQVGIEADDIIGSFAKQNTDYEVAVLTSDKDLLQLIDDRITVILMKKGLSEIEIVDEDKLHDWMGITPPQIIDLKALMGDTADNIKGVAGIGEKTALKLIKEYGSIENLYQNLHNIKGKLLEKLENGRLDAQLSKTLATIVTDAQLALPNQNFEVDMQIERLNAFNVKYEFKSLIKQVTNTQTSGQIVTKISPSILNEHTIMLLQYDNEHYLQKQCIGASFMNQDTLELITIDNLLNDHATLTYLKNNPVITYDAKMHYHLLAKYQIEICDFKDDIAIMAFLIDTTISDYTDLVMKYQLSMLESKDDIFGKKGKPKLVDLKQNIAYFSQEITNLSKVYPILKEELISNELTDVYYNIELPLTKVLYKMEKQGIRTDVAVLDEIGTKTAKIIDELSTEIYDLANKEFNINSPKQLAEILFDDLGLTAGKKRSTAIDVLESLQNQHPIIEKIIQHRKYQKLYSTYVVGLKNHIQDDGKIHTTYNQLITATGRLSSVEPNLQNISAKDEDTKAIRKAFIASDNHYLLSFDYSQIELRIIADMANETRMIADFNQNLDIHKTAAQTIFNTEEVTNQERRFAKAINFGIIYGMSEFGLSQQLNISIPEAKRFIQTYFKMYPNIQKFMHQQIKFCEENGYVKTMFNRRRMINEIHDSNTRVVEFAKRAAMNTPIQGSAADIIKLAMIAIDKKLESYESKMILQVHDELVFDCVESEKDELFELIHDTMCNIIKSQVKLEVDGSFGKNYLETK